MFKKDSRDSAEQGLTELGLFDFFFFQAEDGIRDLTVTGVQTCALPIFCCTSPASETISSISASMKASRRSRVCRLGSGSVARKARSLRTVLRTSGRPMNSLSNTELACTGSRTSLLRQTGGSDASR